MHAINTETKAIVQDLKIDERLNNATKSNHSLCRKITNKALKNSSAY